MILCNLEVVVATVTLTLTVTVTVTVVAYLAHCLLWHIE